MKLTDGEFVVIFDADHVADRHFIDRLIGYFAEPKLGFVQTPHAFYNFDAYQGILDYRRGVYWEEGMLFYNVTQPGKNRWNGVTFCGSAAMFRRQALVEAGMVATESITEDMHTGLRMHAKGWQSLFVNERLISALAAQDITSFNTQRLRWGEGNLGIFAFDNPLTIPGLTLAQRICYLGSMLSWTTGVQKLLIYLTPMLMLITDVGPIKHFDLPLGIITALYMTAVWGGFKIASNGYGHLWGIELSQMIGFWTQVQATWRALFRRRLARFIVTAKRGRQSNSVLRNMMPQILYIVGSTVSITWALTRYYLDLSHDLIAVAIGSALLLVHSILAWTVIRRALRPRDYRASWRHPAALHVAYRSVDANGQPVVGQGVTRDINENGVAFVTFTPLTASQEVTLSISGGGQTVTCRGLIRAQTLDVNHSTGRRSSPGLQLPRRVPGAGCRATRNALVAGSPVRRQSAVRTLLRRTVRRAGRECPQDSRSQRRASFRIAADDRPGSGKPVADGERNARPGHDDGPGIGAACRPRDRALRAGHAIWQQQRLGAGRRG